MNGFLRATGKIVIDRTKQRLLAARRGPGRQTRARYDEDCRDKGSDRGGRKGKGVFQCSFGIIVLTLFVLENVRMLLVNDDATVAGFSGTEWKTSVSLIQAFHSISLAEIRALPPASRFRFSFAQFSPTFLVRRQHNLATASGLTAGAVLTRAASTSYKFVKSNRAIGQINAHRGQIKFSPVLFSGNLGKNFMHIIPNKALVFFMVRDIRKVFISRCAQL